MYRISSVLQCVLQYVLQCALQYVLQCVAVCCSVLLCAAVYCSVMQCVKRDNLCIKSRLCCSGCCSGCCGACCSACCNVLQRTLQNLVCDKHNQPRACIYTNESTTHCNIRCNTLHHTATHCNTLHHTATHSKKIMHVPVTYTISHLPVYISTSVQHTATYAATHYTTLQLQHTATHSKKIMHVP